MPTELQLISKIFPSTNTIDIIEDRREKLASQVLWRRVRVQRTEDDSTSGLAYNLISCNSKNFSLFTPFTFENNAENAGLEKAIANAFWQTVWAGDHIRQAAGEVYPVAFCICQPRFHISQQHTVREIEVLQDGTSLIGATSILMHKIQRLIKEERISFSGKSFRVKGDCAIEEWLNKNAFVDRFIGSNASSGGTGCIRKFIPVANSHLISKTVHKLQTGSTGEFDNRFHAFLNAGFFLNFPEEYMSPFAALNDPVGLIIADEKILQIPLVKRGTILIDIEGRSRIIRASMADIAINLPWLDQWIQHDSGDFSINNMQKCGAEIIIYTPSFRAIDAPDPQKTPAGDVVDIVIIFGQCVALTSGGGVQIPENGIVLSLPGKVNTDRILHYFKTSGHQISFKFINEKYNMSAIRCALSAGPVLVQNGNLICESFFDDPYCEEEFVLREPHSPSHFAAIAPTRFPFDTTRTRAPRSFLALDGEYQIVCGVIDGRDNKHSTGTTLQETAALCRVLGYRSALNLDGGGSSVLMLTSSSIIDAELNSHVVAGTANLPSDVGNADRLMPVSIAITS